MLKCSYKYLSTVDSTMWSLCTRSKTSVSEVYVYIGPLKKLRMLFSSYEEALDCVIKHQNTTTLVPRLFSVRASTGKIRATRPYPVVEKERDHWPFRVQVPPSVLINQGVLISACPSRKVSPYIQTSNNKIWEQDKWYLNSE